MMSPQRCTWSAMKSGEIRRRHRLRNAAEADDAVAHLGIGQALVHDAVDPGDDRGRRARGRDDGLPGIRRHAGVAGFVHGRHVGKFRQAVRARYRERAQLAALEIGHDAGCAFEGHIHLPGQHVGGGLRGAFVGHEHDVGAGEVLEHFAAQMRRRADHRAVIQFAGIGLGVGDEFLDAVHGQRDALTASTCGVEDNSATAVKSLTGSMPAFL